MPLQCCRRFMPRPKGWLPGPRREGLWRRSEAAAEMGKARIDLGWVFLQFHPHIGGYCRKIGFPGRLILSKGKGLWEIWFSWKYPTRIDFPGSLILYSDLQSRVCLTKKARNPPFGSMQFSRLCEASLEVYDRVTGCNCYKCRASDLRGW